MKKIFFLVGLPRAGNTLFSSIINQNPDIAVTANSITADIIYNLCKLKDLSSFKNYPDHRSFNNIAHHIFDLYYKDWNYKYIIDRSCWGTPDNLKIIKENQKNIKIIVLVRDIIEILASFILWSQKNPNTFIDQFNVKTVEEKCDKLMQEDGIILKNLLAIRHLLLPQNKDLYHLIEYNDFVKNPKQTIEEVYHYLEISKFKHRYINLNQFEINGMKYDDTVLGERLHFVKTDKVAKSNYDAYNIIPKTIVEKYKKLNIWKL